MSLDTANAEYVTEIGYQLLLQGKPKEAMRCYRNATQIDDSSVAALTGESRGRRFRFSFPDNFDISCTVRRSEK